MVVGALRDAIATRRLGPSLANARGLPRSPDSETFSGVWTEVRQTVRALGRSPGFTTVYIVTMAVGVGAATAMFTSVNAVLIRPLPFDRVDRIVVIRQTDTRDGTVSEGISAANMRDVAAASRTLTHGAVANVFGHSLQEEDRALSIRGWAVSTGFFEATGVEAQLGRTFLPTEYEGGRDAVALLSDGFWRSRFASDPDVVGRTLLMDGLSYTVVGVLPADFAYPSDGLVWLPRAPRSWDEDVRGSPRLRAVARMASGATLTDVQAELDRIAADLARVHPEANQGLGLKATSLRDDALGHVRTPLLLLFGAVLLVLLVAVANVTGLQLARAANRGHEYALRSALGAGRGRLLRLAFVESALLATVGGGLGVLATWLGTDLLRTVMPAGTPGAGDLTVDLPVAAFALLVTFGSSLVAGGIVALGVSRRRADIGRGARGSTEARNRRTLRDHLVVTEIALALTLAVGAGLLLRSLDTLLDNQLGFDPERRLAVQVFAYTAQDRPDMERIRAFRDAIAEVPGVRSVGFTTAIPGADDRVVEAMDHVISLSLDASPNTRHDVRVSDIDEEYPAALGLNVLAGRTFTSLDEKDGTAVALVNEAFARRYFGETDVTGGRLSFYPRSGSGTPQTLTVVGVVSDVRVRGFESPPVPEVYRPLIQTVTTGGVTFVVEGSIPPGDLLLPVQEAIWATDRSQAVWAAQSLSDLMAGWTQRRRFDTALLTFFAGLAVGLAAIGLYGLMAFSVEQRAQEMGIRRALGGQSAGIVRLVVGRGIRLAVLGVVMGLAGSLVLSRVLGGMLYGVSPLDPATLATASGGVLLLAGLAAYGPARRATRADPMQTLSGRP